MGDSCSRVSSSSSLSDRLNQFCACARSAVTVSGDPSTRCQSGLRKNDPIDSVSGDPSLGFRFRVQSLRRNSASHIIYYGQLALQERRRWIIIMSLLRQIRLSCWRNIKELVLERGGDVSLHLFCHVHWCGNPSQV